MTKKEILSLDNESLIAKAMEYETLLFKEENYNRKGITMSTKKEYKWIVEEVANRFNLDLKIFIEKLGSAHWWEE